MAIAKGNIACLKVFGQDSKLMLFLIGKYKPFYFHHLNDLNYSGISPETLFIIRKFNSLEKTILHNFITNI